MNSTPRELYRERLTSNEIEPDPTQEQAVGSLQRLYDELGSPKKGLFGLGGSPPRGIYMWGGVGRGKSMLMDMFFDSVPASIGKRRVHFHEFMIGVHDYLHAHRQKKDDEKSTEAGLLLFAKELSKDIKLLCFDEFHVTDVADAMILGRLFTALFKHKMAVVMTTNWNPDRLYEGGLQRELFLPFIDLLKEKMEIIHLSGETDYRMQCLSDSGTYFTPLGAGSEKKADALFVKLTENAQVYEETLSVKKRDMKVSRTAKGVARFTFSELCERPVGAEDFLAIAQNYHTVFLEGIPRLGYDRRNETKRLMTLVDALYDTRTKLVVIAAEAPEELYHGKDYKFEFERTVSRLIEMQSTEYLGKERFSLT